MDSHRKLEVGADNSMNKHPHLPSLFRKKKQRLIAYKVKQMTYVIHIKTGIEAP